MQSIIAEAYLFYLSFNSYSRYNTKQSYNQTEKEKKKYNL